MSYDSLPPIGDLKQREFVATDSTVNWIALALGGYILLVIYPSYGLLRLLWASSGSAFDMNGILVAVATSVLFGLFARMLMRRYFNVRR